jgi:iron complex transport system permease protein
MPKLGFSSVSFRLIILLAAILLVLAIVDMTIGSLSIPIFNFIDALHNKQNEFHNIVFQIRIPKLLTAIFVGGALAVAGQIMQTLFKNPLAGPDILGVSSGAGMMVAIGTLVGIPLGLVGNTMLAVCGSMATLFLLLSISNRFIHLNSILLAGVMIASFSGSITTMMTHYSQSIDLQRYVFWTHGSLGGIDLYTIPVLLLSLMLPIIFLHFYAASLDGFQLGEEQALSLGIDVKKLKWITLIFTALMSGIITAFCGPISFVGIAVPFLTRSILRSPFHRDLILGNFLVGAIFLTFCDVLSNLFSFQIPINAMTSLIGAPIVFKAIVGRIEN